MSASTESETVTVFVDTNCFIQLRDLKDLPWKELFPAASLVVIVVASIVMDELDAKKNDRNRRVRDRARLALKLISEASRAEGMELVLKNGAKPRLLMRLNDIGRLDWESLALLDPTRADDVLVAEAMQSPAEASKVLLSHDTGPRIRARRCGLEALEIPEHWLLSEEPDEEAREIARLKRENETLRNRFPKIEAAWLEGNAEAKRLVVERLKLRPLSEGEILELADAYRKTNPKERGVFHPNLGFGIGGESGFSQSDYEHYSRAYDKFSTELPAFFETLHSIIEQASPTTEISFQIQNKGFATAEGLTVDFWLSNEWLVFADEEDAQHFYGRQAAAPKPPLTPQLQKVREADRMIRSIARPDFRQPQRDPTGFYWEDRPGVLDHSGALRCEKFRAKAEFKRSIWIYPWGEQCETAALELEVHASNLSEPIFARAQLSTIEVEVEWSDPRVLNRVEDAIRPLLVRRFGVT